MQYAGIVYNTWKCVIFMHVWHKQHESRVL